MGASPETLQAEEQLCRKAWNREKVECVQRIEHSLVSRTWRERAYVSNIAFIMSFSIDCLPTISSLMTKLYFVYDCSGSA